MASIDKLLVTGIRSFSPQEQNVIEFYTPLTLIIGHNGAGKTTIIECLKYVTTGDLPPNSKGGAFIHDPKVANEREVKAQIKLKFRNVSGKQLVCTRSLQLTQRAKKIEMKTLENVLMTKDPITGEKVSLSGRCADLDREMPLQLGVSKAILENVIFCHQEDSNWPLSEPSILKKKFDEIFAATRYTRAVDSIKDLKKEQAGEIRQTKERLDHMKIHRENAQKLQAQLGRHEAQIEESNQKLRELNHQENALNELLQKAEEDYQEYCRVQNEIKTWMAEKIILEKSASDMKDMMTLYQQEEDDASLMARFEELQKRHQSADNELTLKVAEKEKIEKNFQISMDELNQLCLRKAMILSEKEVIYQNSIIIEAHSIHQARRP
jgi:DNA repair protein RAD50